MRLWLATQELLYVYLHSFVLKLCGAMETMVRSSPRTCVSDRPLSYRSALNMKRPKKGVRLSIDVPATCSRNFFRRKRLLKKSDVHRLPVEDLAIEPRETRTLELMTPSALTFEWLRKQPRCRKLRTEWSRVALSFWTMTSIRGRFTPQQISRHWLPALRLQIWS